MLPRPLLQASRCRQMYKSNVREPGTSARNAAQLILQAALGADALTCLSPDAVLSQPGCV